MIHGIGTDIVHIARIRAACARHGERFVRRVLAADELPDYAAAADPPRLLAKRFAAKEAFAKALGTGVVKPATLHAIRVGKDAAGKPLFRYGDELAAHLAARGLRAHLSLSDEVDYVVAFAVLETGA